MRLYTSMDLPRLAEFRAKLFPGAPPQILVGDHKDAPGTDQSPSAALYGLLASRPEGTVLWSDEIQALTGIRSSDLRRTMGQREVRAVAEGYGWRLVRASDLGQSGKRLGIYRETTTAAPSDLSVAA